jgi:hypothetical protein
MNKEFILYEQAMELKELGFDEECLMYYDYSWTLVESGVYECKSGVYECKAPLYQQAFRWFREKYNLREQYGAFPHHTIITNYLIDGNNEENAELECLKKLIEIVKTNK